MPTKRENEREGVQASTCPAWIQGTNSLLAPPGLEPRAQAQREEEQSEDAGEQTEEQGEGEEEADLDLNAVQSGGEATGDGGKGRRLDQGGTGKEV